MKLLPHVDCYVQHINQLAVYMFFYVILVQLSKVSFVAILKSGQR